MIFGDYGRARRSAAPCPSIRHRAGLSRYWRDTARRRGFSLRSIRRGILSLWWLNEVNERVLSLMPKRHRQPTY